MRLPNCFRIRSFQNATKSSVKKLLLNLAQLNSTSGYLAVLISGMFSKEKKDVYFFQKNNTQSAGPC